MPDIPDLPGVPTLSSFSSNILNLLVEDALSFAFGALDTWGIFLLGVPVLPNMNSLVTFEYRKDWNIPDYIFESGGFQSYNKVQLPYETRVRITSKGTLLERQLLFAEVEHVAASTALYTIVTPERTFLSANVSHFDIVKRTNSNVGILIIDLWFTEIRSNTLANLLGSALSFLNTISATDQATQALGNVQTSSFDEQGFSGFT